MRSPRIHLAHRQQARTQARLLYLENPSEEAIAARHNFEAFRWFVKKHKTYAHHRSWEPYLNTGENSRCLNAIAGNDLLLLAPRGSSKSTFLIEWVAWQIGRHASPEIGQALKILYVSYELKTARQKSQQVKRLLMLPEYKKVFPWIKPGENWANELWEIDFNHAGLPAAEEPYTLAAAGLIGNLTGKRCVVGSTLVITEHGNIPISNLLNHIGIKVLSFNEWTKRLEWRSLANFASRPSADIFELKTSSGRSLRCTSDHPIYTLERGYVKAMHLLPGETLVVTPKKQGALQSVPWMQERSGRYNGKDLQRLLSQRKECISPFPLPRMPVGFWSTLEHSKEEVSRHKIEGGNLLQSGVCSQRQSKAQELRSLWCSNCLDVKQKTWSPMPKLFDSIKGKPEGVRRQAVQSLPSVVSSAKPQASLLLSQMRQQRSCHSDGRSREQQLQDGRKLLKRILGVERTSSFERQLPLRSLWGSRNQGEQGQVGHDVKFGYASYQSQSFGQPLAEPDNTLSWVSRNSSQIDGGWKTDTVFSVARLSTGVETVYDIEVEGNHNFFANGVLIENCHLSVFDDLIKSPESIANPDIREQMVSNYRNIIKPTRFDGGRSVCLGTRMRPDDIYCTEFIPENDWDVIEQSAIITHPDGSEESYWEPEDDNSPGQTLVFLQNIREKEPETFSYQYQNKVIPIKTQAIAPGLITRGLIPNKMEILVLGVDLSAGMSEKNDFTAFTLGGMAFNERRHPHYYTIDCWEGRAMGNRAKLEAIKELYDCWRHLCKYMEIWVESNAYQLSFVGDYHDYVAEQGLYDWRVNPVPSVRDKLQRLRGVTGILENKCHTFNTYGRLIGKLTLQLTQWGSTAHDDLADSFVFMLNGIRNRMPLSSGNYADN